MASRKPHEISRAIARLNAEPLLPLSEVAGEGFDFCGFTLRPNATTLQRWGIEGKAGVFLDVLYSKRRAAWVTSRAAVERFRKALAAKLAPELDSGRPQK